MKDDIIKEGHRKAQNAARETIHELNRVIRPGMSEKEIETLAIKELEKRGSTSWWYHGIGALVLLAKRSHQSLGSRDYYASEDNILGENDVITIDLAPTIEGCWGDYARTLFMENGKTSPEDEPTDPLFKEGLEAEKHIHALLMEKARPNMSLEEVFFLLNDEIDRIGFVNLDFKKNLGHTVEDDEKDRVYLEQGVKATFAELSRAFTLEPHIAKKGADRGFKRENIYYFEGETLYCL